MTAPVQYSARPRLVLRDWGLALSHGLSQIFFQANIWTGLLILAAFVVADWRMALLVLLGCLSSSLGGLLLRVPMNDIRAGMQGFCGALVGAAVFAAMGGQGAAYPVTVLAGLLCAPVALGIVWVFTHGPLKPLGLPSTTAPFCLVAGVMFVSTVPLHSSGPAGGETEGSALSVFAISLLTNVSQVVLIDNLWAAALILLGLFVASWKVGLAAAVGSIIGSVCAFAMNESLQEIQHGLAGYSGVLTAIAFATVFLRGTWEPWLLAVVGAALTAVVTLAMHELPGPVYTWPYILTTWVGLVIVHFVPRLRRA